MPSEPFVAVQSLAAGRRAAVFGYALASIQTSRLRADGQTADPGQRTALLNRQVDFVNTLASLGEGVSVHIRYISRPDRRGVSRGTVRAALLVRAVRDSEEACRAEASNAAEGIWPNLVAMSDAYEWAPLGTEEGLRDILAPFEFAHAAEMTRREALVEIDRIEPMPRVGFAASGTPGDVRGRTASGVHVVFPFVRAVGTLERMFRSLLLQASPVALTVSLAPTALRQDEIESLRAQTRKCEAFLQVGPAGPIGDAETISLPLKTQAGAFVKGFIHDLFTLSDNAYVLRVTAASPAPLNNGALEAVGVAMTEHVCADDVDENGAAGSEMGGHFAGGFAWHRPRDEAETRDWAGSIALLDPAVRAPSLAPEEGRRLRDLVDGPQANAAFRLPLPVAGEFPGIATRMSATSPPPPEIPDEGLLIGTSIHQGFAQPVRLLDDDRRRHVYVVGQTGTGKTTLFLRMILEDIRGGKGVGVLDPHGELIDAILERIPASRAGDVVVIDPEDREFPVGLNLLEYRDEIELDFAIGHLLEIFDKLYDLGQTGGPVFEMSFRNGCLLAMTALKAAAGMHATLEDVARVFSDSSFRAYLLSDCPSERVKAVWEEILGRMSGESSLPNIAAYVTSKLTRFVDNPTIRPIVLQRESTIDFREAMDSRKIVLMNLCKGRLGETNSSFLGMVFMGKLLYAAFSRADARGKEPLSDFHLYVDEFQNFATPTFVGMLSEARKYRLCANLTHQYLHQIPQAVQDAVLGNVGTIVSLRVGIQDAKILEKEFYPPFAASDLANLPTGEGYISTLVRGAAVRPFSFRGLRDETEGSAEVAAEVRRMSRVRYGRRPQADESGKDRDLDEAAPEQRVG